MIKKIYSFILLITIISIHSQTIYAFDYKLQFKSSFDEKYTITYMMNSKNPQYDVYMDENHKGALFDNEKNIRRDFIRSTGTNYSFLNRPFTPSDKRKINHIVVEKIGDHRYSIKCYPKKRNKNCNLELEVHLRPFSEDIIRFYYSDLDYKMDSMLVKSLKEKLEGNYHYIVESYSIYDENGKKNSRSLEKIEKINLKIAP